MNTSDQDNGSIPNGVDQGAQEPQGESGFTWEGKEYPLDLEYAKQMKTETWENDALSSLPLVADLPIDDFEHRVWEEGRDNFVEQFIALQGLTETPNIYFRFVAISIISALLQNKVWLELSAGSPLYPNLYIFLLGQSGIGKGQSIGAGLKLLADSGLADDCGQFTGTFTAAALIDFLASKAGKGKGTTSRAFIVSPEFASSIKWGDQSEAIIKTMTDLFTGDLSNYTDMTRTKGMVKVGRPCVSWLAASTRDWLISNLKPDAMKGGFMARCLFAEATRKTPGVPMPVKPRDYRERFAQLQLQLVDQISRLAGEFTLSPEATYYLRVWYERRIPPIAEAALASWNRHRELALKIAMTLCAGDPKTAGVISLDQLYEAIFLVEEAKAAESGIWAFIGKKGKLSDIEYIANKIQQAKNIDHAILLNQVAAGRGIYGKKFQDLILVLEETGKIRRGRRNRGEFLESPPTGKLFYQWVTQPRPRIVGRELKDDYE